MNRTIIDEKSKQVFSILDELALDCWLVWVRETSHMADPVLNLITEGDYVWQSAFIFTKSGEKLAIVGNFDAGALRSKKIFDKVIPYTKSIKESLVTELERIDPGQLAINFSINNSAADGLSMGMYQLLQEHLKETPFSERFCSAEDLIGKLIGRKTQTELELIRKAVEITETIFDRAKRFVKVGMTELEIYRRFHEQMIDLSVTSAWNVDHNPAVNAGPDKDFGHIGPSELKTKAGHLLNFDFGVRYHGYCSDLQRMFFFGSEKDIPDEITEAFEAVHDAIKAASEFIKPGVQGYEVDAVARDLLEERGYYAYQHGLGHQMGRHAHDGGTILGPLWERYGNTPKGLVEEGNVFTLEPSVITPSYGPVSLEEDIVITKTGCKFISKPQEKLICIE